MFVIELVRTVKVLDLGGVVLVFESIDITVTELS